jgi:putative iron-regulated protein
MMTRSGSALIAGAAWGVLFAPAAAPASGVSELCARIVAHYGDLVHATYCDAYDRALDLQQSLQSFVEEPTEQNMSAAKAAWIRARQPYLQSEAFRFYAGPIDDDDGPEPMINGWPLDEGIIDYVQGAPESGIINQPKAYPLLTKEVIAINNERAGETAITSGYHAIEFLLWGQDFSDTGPGTRPVSDYLSHPSAARRGTYLSACGDLLTDHIRSLVGEWEPGKSGNFRSAFESRDPVAAVRSLLYGLHALSGKELGGERLLVAWDTRDQEAEHSCFSDTTDQDARYDAQGIYNVYHGRYLQDSGRIREGPGIRDLVVLLEPKGLEQWDANIQDILKAVARIPAPFDQAILGENDAPGRRAIMDAVEQLEDAAQRFAHLDQIMAAQGRGESGG